MIQVLAIVAPHGMESFRIDSGPAGAFIAGLLLLTFLLPKLLGRWIAELVAVDEAVFASLRPKAAPESLLRPLDPEKLTAVLFVTDFNAFGVQMLTSLWKSLPEPQPQILFLGTAAEWDEDKERLRRALRSYLPIAGVMGLSADVGIVTSSDPLGDTERACLRIAESYRSVVYCSGTLTLASRGWIARLLSDGLGDAVRRRLQRRGLPTLSLAVRPDMKKAAARAAALSG